MLIKSITLKNFRQYKGEQKIEFSTDSENNVTVIKGENGAGKTTLLEAFVWCLYNDLNLPNKDKLLNADVLNKMEKQDVSDVSVEINLEHNKNDYYIIRTEKYMKSSYNEADRLSRNLYVKFKNNDGTLTDIDNNEINNILPSDLSSYFFFDGERIENLSKSNRKGKKDISDAVKNILGLDILLNAKKHLSNLIKEFEEEYDQENSEEMKSLKEKIKKYRSKYNSNQKLLDATENNIDIVSKKIEDLNEKISDKKEAEELQNQREKKENELVKLSSNIKIIEKDIEKLNKNSLPEFVASKLLNLFSNKFDLSNIQTKGISGIDGSAIDVLIERKKCICGEDVVPDGHRYHHLLEQKRFQPPASLGTIILQFKEKTDDVINKGQGFLGSLENKYRQIESLKEQIEELEKDIANISKQLKGAGEVKDLEEEREKLKEDLDGLRHKLTDYISESKILKDKIDRTSKNLDKLALNDVKNNKIAIRKKYTSMIENQISEYYAEKEEETRKALNREVSHTFKNLIETNHKIIINDDYTFKVVDIDGAEATSQGQDVITSFAFIGGLINLVKEKHEDIEVTDPYPLIMDAPFAKLSNAHRKNVAELLPDIVEQFILFTVDSQYEGEIEDALKSRIGKEYVLEMHIEDEKYTKVVGG